MQKISFKNDYSNGCHQLILQAIASTNESNEEGYGLDYISIKASDLIKKAINNPKVDIHFVTGGTQANIIVCESALKPYEAVISASTGHINIHETGAIEAIGHKIININSLDGKLYSFDIENEIVKYEDEHMVVPKLVYISNSTELGTIYKKTDLISLYNTCKKHNLFLFMDGARIGSALTSLKSDLTLEDISKYTDVFYIGGTKNGALLGEAIVINNEHLKENFRYIIKQKGALLAKGRILGCQFEALFSNNLFFELSTYANNMASKLSTGINSLNYEFLSEPESNQLFPIIPNNIIERLKEKFEFYIWSKPNNTHSVIRLVTSWTTKESDIDAFLSELSTF